MPVAPAPPPVRFSDDSCEHANDGYCDEPYECDVGTDTTDCSQAGFENGNSQYCRYAGDGECDEVQYCPAGSDTHDCCSHGQPRETDQHGTPVVAANVCCGGDCVPPGPDWCQYANDGTCDEPQGSGECPAGSDTTDCAGVVRECQYIGDGECDEGGTTGYCPAGSDTADCCENGQPRETDGAGAAIDASQVDCSVAGITAPAPPRTKPPPPAPPPYNRTYFPAPAPPPSGFDDDEDDQAPDWLVAFVLVIMLYLGFLALFPVVVMVCAWCCCIKPKRDAEGRRPTRKAWHSCCGVFWLMACLGFLIGWDGGPILWLLGSVLMVVPFCRDGSYTDPHGAQQQGVAAAGVVQATVVQPMTSHNPVVLAPGQPQQQQQQWPQQPQLVEAKVISNTGGGGGGAGGSAVAQPLISP
jgi:hypothetical protein